MRVDRLALIALSTIGLVAGLTGSTGAQTRHPAVVRANPANTTPHLADDATDRAPRVHALARRGGTIYIGGLFRKVQSPKRKFTKTRTNVAAFRARTGAFTSFAPKVNGAVWAVRTTRKAVFLGGDFTKVNGVSRQGLAKLNRKTGRVLRKFKAPFESGRVTDLGLVRGRLIVGGTFPRRLIALRPDTGKATGYLKIGVKGQLAGSSGRTGVFKFAVNPSHRRLVAVGNFTRVAGKQRERAFMLNLRDSRARLSRWWYEPFGDRCAADGPTRQAYLQDVDFAPSGKYFVVVSTGYVPALVSQIGTHVCDAAARFEVDRLSPNRPTWINYTGGDTLHAVAITGAAVYVQGHSRWLDNPFGRDSAGDGAVERRGGGAINSKTGKALPWNPSMPNQIGGYGFMATPHGLWIGRDGKRIGGEYHRGLAFMPLP